MENHAKRGARSDNQKATYQNEPRNHGKGAKMSQGGFPKHSLWNSGGKVVKKVVRRDCFWEALVDDTE